MRAAWLPIAVLLAIGPQGTARAQLDSSHTNPLLFAAICATSIGFGELDGSVCEQDVVWDPAFDEPRKEEITREALLANALAGNLTASAVLAAGFTGGIPVPYVRLNQDPCDRYASNGGDGCSSVLRAGGATVFGARRLNDTLTDEQEALLGCGAYWGTDCEVDGIDLRNAEASVLTQSWPDLEAGGTVVLPGARGPAIPSYDADVDGCIAPLEDPACIDASALEQPLSGDPFSAEMAALSWNYLMTLVAFSAAEDPAAPGADDFDPANPARDGEGLCSFAQPQYCSAVIAFLPEPGAALGALAAFAALAQLARRRR